MRYSFKKINWYSTKILNSEKTIWFCKMLKHERKAKTLLSFLIFTGKLKFAKFVFSHCFIFPNKAKKQKQISYSVQFSLVQLLSHVWEFVMDREVWHASY